MKYLAIAIVMGLINGSYRFKIKLNFCVFTALILMFLSVSQASGSGIKVVASIPPVQSLVAGVMSGVGVPRLLVQDGQSPHTFFMKPSSARMLSEAQVVFWVGPEIEGFLVRPLAALPQEINIVKLAKVKNKTNENLTLDSGVGDAHEHHDHDPHIWLDPRKALDMVGIIADTLSRVDSVNAIKYRKNKELIVAQLALLEKELLKTLSPISSIPFLVFHNAYSHFEDRFGLASKGAVVINFDRPPGAKRISLIRHRIVNLKIACIFIEPQFNPSIAKTLIEGTSSRIGVLDPLGVGLAPGPSLYFELMHGLANSFLDCLRTYN